ncbi:MAG: acetyl-CoA carboxylase biotin carboxyl carrier protein [Ramlibacter sp.]
MQIDDVRQLSAWLAATDIELLELRGPDHHLCLRREGEQVVVVTAEEHAQKRAEPPLVVSAASVGVFLQGHPLRPEALIRAGERVRAGQVLALLKIGALLLPVSAPRDGIALRPLVAHGTTVGFGTPLFEMGAL